MIDFGRDVCGRIEIASRREWLVTNGIGGFAMGTIAGMLSRRYHGLLIAALAPPLGRTLMVAKIDETAFYGDQYFPLYVDQWFGDLNEEPGIIKPHGHYNLEHFRLDGTIPVWTYACADALLEKRIWMEQGENTTYVQYRLIRGSGPLSLYPKVLINYRDFHQTTIAAEMGTEVEPVDHGLKIRMQPEAFPLYLLASQGEVYPQDEWYEDYYLAIEEERGMPDIVDDHLHIADFAIDLEPGKSAVLVASTRPDPDLDGPAAFARRRQHEEALLTRAEARLGPLTGPVRQLVLAADQFIVQRPTPSDPRGHSILAGYPWFSDWGRDTLISLPGLTLCTGRPEIAASVLRTYAQFIDQGMVPNRFPDQGDTPEYNTADASLWYFQALQTYLEAEDDEALLRDVYSGLQEIIDWYARGTRYNIHLDPADGLLFAGEPGIQVTWMDVKIGDWVVTPRTGKPIEINALWYNALETMIQFAERLGEDSLPYQQMAARARQGFQRYWNSPEGTCFDVLDGPEGHDPAVRPNQLLAVSLSFSPLHPERQKAVVDVCVRQLLTSHGLRSLGPNEAAYTGQYAGDARRRDSAYHQGTVWGWLIGPLIGAHLRVYQDPQLALSDLEPGLRHLVDHGLGSMSEIFDGDPPFHPHGCPAQAWSVAEYLRGWCMIHQALQVAEPAAAAARPSSDQE